MKRFAVAALCLVALTAVVPAQCTQVSGPNNPNNGQNGCMFDVVNVSASTVYITHFDQSWFSAGTSNVAIFTKAGTLIGSESTPGAWTLLGTAINVAHPVTGILVPVPLNLSVGIPSGATQAFYITANTTGAVDNVAYTTGAGQLGAVIGSDANIQIKAGVGKGYSFAATFGLPTDGRLWNGRLSYGFTASTPYQLNSQQASFDVNGLVTAGCSPASSQHCFGQTINVNMASTTLFGNGWEIALGLSPLVTPGTGASVTANGQVLNVNLADPNFQFLLGLTFPPFPAPFGAVSPMTVPIGMPPLTIVSAQMAILDATHPDGFRLSQAFELHGIGTGATSTASGPAGDDVGLTINAGQTYTDGLCGSFVAPALPLFGTSVTSYNVITNGRITWNFPDTSPTPAVAAAMSGQRQVGCWADFTTTLAGNVSLALVGTTFVASWNGIAYFNQPASASSFAIAIDSVTGVITITGISSLYNQATLSMFLGIAKGSGATNPGQAAFGPAGSGAAASPNDMIYRFGTAGPAIAAGANLIVFTPDGSGNYTWTSN